MEEADRQRGRAVCRRERRHRDRHHPREQIVALQNVGLPVNRNTIENQITGAVIQGLSFCLFEDRILNRQTGAMVNPNMDMYKIAGPVDVPEIVPVIWREDRDVGVNSLGEPPVVPTPGAIATAVANAIGAQVRSMPLTPDKVLAAVARRAESKRQAGGNESDRLTNQLTERSVRVELLRLPRCRAVRRRARRVRRGQRRAQGGRHRSAGPHEGGRRDRRTTVLSIGGLDELRYIREENDGVHIGCLTTLADIGRNDLLKIEVRGAAPRGGRSGHAADSRAGHRRRQPLPAAAVLVLPQQGVQLPQEGRSTLASPSRARTATTRSSAAGRRTSCIPSNVAPALVALDGTIVVRSADGESQQIKAAEFFVLPEKSLMSENILKPGEIISEVIVPKAPSQSATIELREKQSFDWPIAMACVARLDGRLASVPGRRGADSLAQQAGDGRARQQRHHARAGRRRRRGGRERRRADDRQRIQSAAGEGGHEARAAHGRRVGGADMELNDRQFAVAQRLLAAADAVLRATWRARA